MRVSWEKSQRAILCAFLFCLPTVTLAETLAMPDREGLVGQDVVVWGVTDQAGNYTLDCGNGTTATNVISDGSYIPLVCNYASEGTFTATLTTDAVPESDTVDIAVFDGAGLSAIELRGLRINMAIEDGLRYLWTSQFGRAANFPASVTTNWGNFFPYSDAAFVALAFQNQGYTLPNNNSMPTGIYEKYIVRRAINYVLANLSEVTLNVQAGNDPCVGPGIEAAPCVGYATPGDAGYAVAIAILPFASSGALARENTEVAGVTSGKTFGEILQRLTNSEAWGMTDAPSARRGGVGYNFNGGQNDGSTAGWAFLAFLDAAAAGATVPAWVETELAFAVNDALNDDGSYDYQGNANSALPSNPGPQKGGIGLQGLFITGELAGARVAATTNYIDSWWDGAGVGSNIWSCLGINRGCAYSMYNNFKGLKLHGIQTLPSVGRPAGPGTIPENDWHEDYKDWLLANQTSPTTVAGGSWGPAMAFSCCYSGDAIETAIAELLLSPVALVLPDPIQFGEIGLQHCLDGVPCTDRTPTVDGEPTEDTNPVGTAHNVVARALSINGDPIPGTTINIDILSGPNAPQNFQGVSNTAGEVQIEYTSEGTAGTDEIQASIGNLTSNVLTKIWEDDAQPQKCDIDGDGDIDRNDINVIFGLRGTTSPPSDPLADLDDNGIININDGRGCVLLCTLPRCASPPN